MMDATDRTRWWSADEEAELTSAVLANQPIPVIAQRMRRSEKALQEKSYQLHLKPTKSGWWPPEREKRLAELVTEELTYSQMAAKLDVTRSMVAGKLRRMGLLGLSGKNHGGPRSTKRVEGSLRRKPWRPVAPALIPEVEIIELPADQSKFMVSLADLDEQNHCRWPLGHPPILMYCGAQKVGHSYCSRHCRIAYQPPKYRRAA